MARPDILIQLLVDELLQRGPLGQIDALRIQLTPLCLDLVGRRYGDVTDLDYEDAVKLLLPELLDKTGLPATVPPTYGATER